MTQDAFFTLHKDLICKGSGEASDVDWACKIVGTPTSARTCEVACGSGGHIAALLAAAPEGSVRAIDKHAAFIRVASETYTSDARAQVSTGDVADLGGSFDLIWCASAVYFLCVTKALTLWRHHRDEFGYLLSVVRPI